ncbi:MAG: 4Fe-4S dicluster domain-containing protein [Candidatus Aureabacteria bacterium]|nr:4Fe-4S dicluster domain-containing protein [Candidatus Auribacterota bacterium]
MKFPKVRELGEALRALFGRRYTTLFPSVKAEVPQGFRGIPQFDAAECIGCGACAIVCPAKDIEITDEVKEGKGVRRLTIHYDDCIFCAQCHRSCPTGKGVVMTEKFDIASGNRHALRESVEKELVLCEMCGEMVAARDHLLWIARRVGPAAYTNPTLMLPLIESLSPSAAAAVERGGDFGRSDRVRVLCPKCRRISTREFSLEK